MALDKWYQSQPRPNSNLSPNALTDGVGRGPSVTRVSQDWVGENVTGKTKSPRRMIDRRVLGSETGFINGGAAHPIKLVFWEEGNGPVTMGMGQIA